MLLCLLCPMQLVWGANLVARPRAPDPLRSLALPPAVALNVPDELTCELMWKDKKREFSFDAVFMPGTSQDQVRGRCAALRCLLGCSPSGGCAAAALGRSVSPACASRLRPRPTYLTSCACAPPRAGVCGHQALGAVGGGRLQRLHLRECCRPFGGAWLGWEGRCCCCSSSSWMSPAHAAQLPQHHAAPAECWGPAPAPSRLQAYGQTGSGKTFTIYGSESDPGLTPRGVSELFNILDRDSSKYNFKVGWGSGVAWGGVSVGGLLWSGPSATLLAYG